MRTPRAPSRVRRGATILVACVLGGGLVSIAIAIAAALWAPLTETWRIPAGAPWPIAKPADWPISATDSITAFEGFGILKTTAHSRLAEFDYRQEGVQAGWPFPCLVGCVNDASRGSNRYDFPTLRPAVVGRTNHGMVSTTTQRTIVESDRWIPLRPNAVGLALDALFWGVMPLAIVVAHRLLRRITRAVRGQCPGCGYRGVASTDRCSECGHFPGLRS